MIKPRKKIIASLLIALAMMASAAPPLWWNTGNPPVIDPDAEINHKGPANIGQAKHMAKSAIDALEAILPDVSDQIESDLTTGDHPILDFGIPDPKTPEWQEKQKAPLRIGQLKAIADPFYTRLNAAKPSWLEKERIANGTNHPGSIFPWTAENNDDANKAIANIGQLKAVFSLRFENIPPVDSDGDGLPDDWEIANGLDPNNPDDALQDFDDDTLSNLKEYQIGTAPDLAADNNSNGIPDDWEIANFGSLVEDPSQDTDEDYLTNLEEFENRTNPNSSDSDSDGLSDYEEVNWQWFYYYETNPNIWDTDQDGLGDGDEIFNHYSDPTNADTDGDSLTDGDEVLVYGTDPTTIDTDFDGLEDAAELDTHGTSPTLSDTDEDELSDGDEIINYMTDPLNPDSDSDGVPDGWEIKHGFDPNDPADAASDLDSDSLTNLQEFEKGSNPTLVDTDHDGLNDGDEVNVHGTDPASADSDNDGLADAEEINTLGTNPLTKDTDGDGIFDFNDTEPKNNFQLFPDADGDGIRDADDPEPNVARGPAPTIGSSSGGADHMVNVIAGEVLNFHLRLSNPAGTAPTASQIKFFINGNETAAATVDLGGGNFVIKWTSTLHTNYPKKIVQLATAKFTDSKGAVAWKNLASVDVAEWEGMIASLRTGTGNNIPGLKVFSHSNGIKSNSLYTMSSRLSYAGWYRGPKDVSFVNSLNGNALLTGQIKDGMRYPLFLISANAKGGLNVAETISISSGNVYRHHGFMLLNYSGYDFRWIFDPGGICTALNGQRSYLALPAQADSPTGYTTGRQEYLEGGEWKLATASNQALYDEQATARKISTARYYPINGGAWDYQGQELLAEVEAQIILHAVGTLEYPGLPLMNGYHTGSSTPALLPIGTDEWHEIILKVGPDAEAVSNGIQVAIHRGLQFDGDGGGKDAPQVGWTFEANTGTGFSPLTLPTDGGIAILPNSVQYQKLTSADGLRLRIKKSSTVNQTHTLGIDLVPKNPADAVNRITALNILPVDLVDTKDKLLDDQAPEGATITAAMRDVSIEPKATVDEQKERSIALIEPHGADDGSNAPDMPQLVLRVRGADQMGLKIKWKLEVIYKRPRGTNPDIIQMTAQDEVFVPKKVSGSQLWNEEPFDGALEFFNHPDWIAELQTKGFFGGEAKLIYQLLKSDGSELGTELTSLFSIGGKNPEDNLAKDYIDTKAAPADSRLTRLSYATGRHESKNYNGKDSRYNQFWEGYARRYRIDHRLGHPLWCKSPDEESAGGFGIFQITGDVSRQGQFAVIPREQMWNWRKNVDAYVTIVKTGGSAAKGPTMDRFIAAVAQTYSSDNEAQSSPTIYPYDGGNYDVWEMGTITLYNGAGGCPKSKLKNSSGKWSIFINPWKYDGSRAAGSRWQYNKNSNNYLHEVIQEK